MDDRRHRKRKVREDLNAEKRDLDAYLNDLRGAISRAEGMLKQLHEHEATVVKVIKDKIGMLKPMQDKYTDLLAKVSAVMEQEEELKSKILRDIYDGTTDLDWLRLGKAAGKDKGGQGS